jgi:methanogenic corrinoid protein MtbC1
VAMLLEVNGFEMYDLGKDVDSMRFVEKTMETQSNIIALSALMTTTKPSQKEVIDLLNEMGIRNKCKVIVGGAAITEKWAKRIGAEGFGDTAEQAVRVAQELVAQE